jgi:M6 family metalloprotease-like protein
MRRMMLMRNAVVPISLILLALGLALAAGSCGSRSLLPLSTGVSGNARSVAVDNLPAPPPGAEAIRRDAPYAGPYRLPHGRMVYTADTIREYGLEGLVEPGVYGPSDPDPLTALTAAAGGEKASSAPPNMDHDGLASPVAGNVKVLVLRVKWQSTPTQPVAIKQNIDDKYSNTASDNDISVKEYYSQQSYGALNLTADVYPSGESEAYELSGSPLWSGSLVYLSNSQGKQMLDLADADGVNFTNHDADGNGYIDALAIVYQRFNNNWVSREHVGSLPSSWPYNINDFTKDEVKVLRAAFHDYTSFSTYDDADYSWWDYTPHHEFGHILGLPDLYDYGGDYAGRNNPGPDGDESSGCGFWCLMAAGIYTLPVQNLSAPLRYCLGWTDAEMVSSNLKDFHLGPVNDSPDNIRRVWRDAAEGE